MKNYIKSFLDLAVIAVALFCSITNLLADDKAASASPAPIDQSAPQYRIKPAEISLPNTATLGQYQRIIRPFLNWTLVCDEDLTNKRKLCNISQKIVKADDQLVFSWSLATAENGNPLFILRIPQNAVPAQFIELNLLDDSKPIHTPIKGCNSTVCVAYVTVDKKLRAKISEKAIVEISFSVGDPTELIKFRLPFEGLSDALATL